MWVAGDEGVRVALAVRVAAGAGGGGGGGDAEDGDGERDGDGKEAGESCTWGIDGRTTDGWRDASAGPTARTAIQTTRRTSTAEAALRTIRAGPSGRAECFAGNGPPLR